MPNEKDNKNCSRTITTSPFSIFGSANANVVMDSAQLYQDAVEDKKEKGIDCLSSTWNLIKSIFSF